MAFGWTCFILYATLSPDDGSRQFEIPIPHFDKVVHFILFFVEAVLLYKTDLFKNPIFQIVIGLALAAFTETMQSFVPGRNPDVWDLIADAGGTIAAFWLLLVTKRS